MIKKVNGISKLTVIFVFALILGACGGGEAGSGAGSVTSTGVDARDSSGSIVDENSGNNPEAVPPTIGAATLSWIPPTQNVDETALTDLSGYKIYYGTQKGNYPNSIAINNPGVTEYVIENLSGSNTYYFVITAFDSQGNESGLSNIASKSI